MSESDYQRIVERVLQSVASPIIATDVGIEAARKVGELAAQEEIEWALAGGLAIHLMAARARHKTWTSSPHKTYR